MASLLNFIWFVFFGWFQGLIFLLIGCLFYLTIVGIPIGASLFQLAKLVSFPFGKEMVKDSERGNVMKTGHTVLNIIWFPFGLILSISCFLIAIPLFIGIITIPIAIVYVRIAKFIFLPFGIQVVSKEEAVARRTAELVMKGQSTNYNPQATAPSIVQVNEASVQESSKPQADEILFQSGQSLSSTLSDISVSIKTLRDWMVSQYTKERKDAVISTLSEARDLSITFRKTHLARFSDKELLSVIAIIVLLLSIGTWAYETFHETEYFVGKDVSVDTVGQVRNISNGKPVSGKIVFSKDGSILLSYAVAVNGYVDTRFETYPNGNPKSELHKTYTWNKDTKSEYRKEWYLDGKMKLYDRYDHQERWHPNGIKSFEWEKYMGDGGGLMDYYGTGSELQGTHRNWSEDGRILSEFIYEGVDSVSEAEFIYNSGAILSEKRSIIHKGYDPSRQISELYFPNGKMQKRTILGVSVETWREDGGILSIADLKNGSGSSFYPSGTVEEHIEKTSTLKRAFFENGNIHYDYLGQIGKTFDESGSLMEECKKNTVVKEVKVKGDCFLIFCEPTRTENISSEIIQCFDGRGKLLYDAPISKWKKITSSGAISEMEKEIRMADNTLGADDLRIHYSNEK